MQRDQGGPTCKFQQIQQYLQLPVTFKTPKKICIHLDAKVIDLSSYLNFKLRDWSTRQEILGSFQGFFIGVSITIGCQELEQHLTLVKNIGSFYNHTEYLFIHTNVKFLSSEKNFFCSKLQNIKVEGQAGQERDREPSALLVTLSKNEKSGQVVDSSGKSLNRHVMVL